MKKSKNKLFVDISELSVQGYYNFEKKYKYFTTKVFSWLGESNLISQPLDYSSPGFVSASTKYVKYVGSKFTHEFGLQFTLSNTDKYNFWINFPVKPNSKLLSYMPIALVCDDNDSTLLRIISSTQISWKNIDNGIKDFTRDQLLIHDEEYNFLIKVIELLNEMISNVNIAENKLKENQKTLIKELDKNDDGEVDLIDGETFNKVILKNQSKIIDIDKVYIQKFVKVSLYLKTKKSNIQKIFDAINKTNDEKELKEIVGLLKNQINTYEILVFHALSMIVSLLENDLITFYEIYETFDKIGVFNSNWENEIDEKLRIINKGIIEINENLIKISNGIKEIMYSIYEMEIRIVEVIENLTYVTEDSFDSLRNAVENKLDEVNSSIKFNSLLNGIQTYQLYKINKNTKRLN